MGNQKNKRNPFWIDTYVAPIAESYPTCSHLDSKGHEILSVGDDLSLVKVDEDEYVEVACMAKKKECQAQWQRKNRIA